MRCHINCLSLLMLFSPSSFLLYRVRSLDFVHFVFCFACFLSLYLFSHLSTEEGLTVEDRSHKLIIVKKIRYVAHGRRNYVQVEASPRHQCFI